LIVSPGRLVGAGRDVPVNEFLAVIFYGFHAGGNQRRRVGIIFAQDGIEDLADDLKSRGVGTVDGGSERGRVFYAFQGISNISHYQEALLLRPGKV